MGGVTNCRRIGNRSYSFSLLAYPLERHIIVANTFFISDTHFGHQGIVKFLRDEGTPLRPFATTEEMDEVLVENWNRVVGDSDRVYHLGDVAINRKHLPTLGRLKGRKKLIRGNHDIFKLKDYTPYFEDIMGVQVLADMILSHIPLHTECMTTRFGTNVHGHLHSNTLDSPYHLNVCVEHTNYTPISIDEVRLKIAANKAKYENAK